MLKFWGKALFLLVSIFGQSSSIAEEASAYIFAGYGSSTTKELYQQIGCEYKKNGIEPVFVEIDWSTGDIVDYIEQAKKIVSKRQESKRYFYGFSLGGLIALALSKDLEPSSIVISSVAPFFKEDIESLRWFHPQKIYNWYLFGSSESVSAEKLVSEINQTNAKVVLLVGSEEKEVMLKRSKLLANALTNGELVVMKNVGHGISEPSHMEYIIQAVNK